MAKKAQLPKTKFGDASSPALDCHSSGNTITSPHRRLAARLSQTGWIWLERHGHLLMVQKRDNRVPFAYPSVVPLRSCFRSRFDSPSSASVSITSPLAASIWSTFLSPGCIP